MTTLHIQPADDAAQGGAGSATDPLRIHGPEHFDSLLHEIAKREEIRELQLLPGKYQTRGRWAHPIFGRAIAIIGDSAEVDLTDPLFPPGRKDTSIFRFGIPDLNNHRGHWHIAGLSVDGREEDLPSDHFVTGGIQVWGHNARISACSVTGLRGHRPTVDNPLHLETFGILLSGHKNGDAGLDGGSVIEQCYVSNKGDRNPYPSAIYAGYQQWDRPLQPTIVRDCFVLNYGPAQGVGFSLQGKTNIVSCVCDGFNYALYNDVGRVEDCFIDRFTGVDIGYCGLALRASLKFEPPGRLPHKLGVRVRDSKFTFKPKTDGEWIGLWSDDAQKTGARFENITFENCDMAAASESPVLASVPAPVRPFTAASLDAANMSGIRMSGRLPGGWKRHLTAQTPQNAIAFTESERGLE